MIADMGPLVRTDFRVLTSDGFSNRGPRDQRFRRRAKENASDYPGSRCASSGNRVIRSASARGIVGRRSGKFRICRLRDGRQRLWQLDQT
jgi:hypothetical protein